MDKPKGHNNLSKKDMEKVLKFLRGLGPYQSDIWSDAYYSEILEFLNERGEK